MTRTWRLGENHLKHLFLILLPLLFLLLHLLHPLRLRGQSRRTKSYTEERTQFGNTGTGPPPRLYPGTPPPSPPRHQQHYWRTCSLEHHEITAAGEILLKVSSLSVYWEHLVNCPNKWSSLVETVDWFQVIYLFFSFLSLFIYFSLRNVLFNQFT